MSYENKYKGISQNKINSYFISACATGDLSEVKYALTQAGADIDTQSSLKNACLSGNIELVRYLCESPELEKHVSIINDCEILITLVIERNNLPLLKYFLEKYSDIYDNPEDLTKAFNTACQNGMFEIAQYLCDKTKININEIKDITIGAACANGHVKVTDLLLELGVDIHIREDLPFRKVCENYQVSLPGGILNHILNRSDNMIKHLLFTHNFKISDNLKDWLEGNNNSNFIHTNTLKYIGIRDLSQKLNEDLKSKEKIVKVKKI